MPVAAGQSFFRLVWFALALVVFAAIMGWIGHGGSGSDRSGRHTALVRLEGEIDDHGKASAENINAALNAAFQDPDSVAVVLNINSPGGSPPVQSSASTTRFAGCAKTTRTNRFTSWSTKCAPPGLLRRRRCGQDFCRWVESRRFHRRDLPRFWC